MAQIKIYGIREKLVPIQELLSDVVHECVIEALQFPRDKKAHRFFLMERQDMIYPSSRSDAYTIIEITMMEGRTVATRKKLIRLLFDRVAERLNITPQDLEICIQEVPACNWGFRGMHGDEVQLNYRVDI